MRLLEEGHDVIGMDNRNNHLYRHKLKDARKHEMKLNVWDNKDIRSNDDWHFMFKHSHDAIQDTQKWHSIVGQRNDARKNGKNDLGFDDHPYFDFIIHLKIPLMLVFVILLVKNKNTIQTILTEHKL